MGRPPQPGIQFKLRLDPTLKQMLDEAAAQNRRTLSAEITERLEISFTPYADLEALPKAYENGRRDALLSQTLDPDEGLEFRDEAELDAKVLLDALPPKTLATAIYILRVLAGAAAADKTPSD